MPVRMNVLVLTVLTACVAASPARPEAGLALLTEAGFEPAKEFDPVTLVLRFAGEPQIAASSRPRSVVLEFANARFPGGARLLAADSELVDAAGLEQVAPDRVRLILKVRAGCSVQLYRVQADPGAEITFVLVLQHEMGEVGKTLAALTWPVRGRVSSHYGWRVHPILRVQRMHHGVDIAVPTGTPVRCLDSGEVVHAGWKGGGGQTVVVQHANGLQTSYKHCSRILVEPGDRVKRHQVVAEVGATGMATGPHLHFTMMRDGESLDPLQYYENLGED